MATSFNFFCFNRINSYIGYNLSTTTGRGGQQRRQQVGHYDLSSSLLESLVYYYYVYIYDYVYEYDYYTTTTTT